MSKQTNESAQLVNNELTERVNNAYIASNYTLLNGGTNNVVMVSGDKDDKSVDVLLTLEGMEEVSQTLRGEVSKKPESNE
jgi:hypothetical protein